jgi:type I restriction enzyme S subunit
MSFNQDIKALIPEKEVDGLFLSFFLASQKEKMRQLVSIAGHGTGRLDTESIKSFPVNLPSLGEQKKIAKILVAWDQAITATEKLLANSQQQKKSLMQQLLTGKQRLHGFSEIQWKEYRLGKLFNERIENNQLDLPLVSITREQGVIWREDVGRKDTSSDDKSKYLRICPGDIGYNTMRMWQGVSALSDIEGLVSPAYTVITPKHGVDGLFMSYLFKLPRTIHNLYRYSQGLTSDTWNLKFRHFKEVTVTIPELEQQQQIARILQKCDQEISGLITMRKTLLREKKALMQQLLTGKRRVKVDEP